MDSTLLDGLVFKLADSEEGLSALEFSRQVYQEELGHPLAESGDREGVYSLVARSKRGEIVAAFRLIGPQARPFDFETIVDLGAVLGPSRTPAVVGRLCVRRDYRGVRRVGFVQMGMLKLAYTFAMKRRISDLLLYTYPNLIHFYRGSFFDLLNVTFEHPEWGLVHLMRMDIEALPNRCLRSRSALATFLLDEDLPNFLV